MSENNGWAGKPGVREKLEYALAMHFSNNRMPHMSGDPRNRLSSLQRRNMEDAVTSILEVIGPALTPAEVDARIATEREQLQAENARLRKLVAYLAGTNTDHVQVALAGNPIVCDAIHAEARAALGETQ
jgi:phage-related minor tail protein